VEIERRARAALAGEQEDFLGRDPRGHRATTQTGMKSVWPPREANTASPTTVATRAEAGPQDRRTVGRPWRTT
jgi:hypothetical protein